MLTAVGGGEDIFVVAYGPDGALRWAWSLGGSGADDVRDLAVDLAGNVYLAGAISGDADFAPGDATALVQACESRQGFVAKYDPEGALVWVTPLDLQGDDEMLALASDGAGRCWPLVGRV